MSPAPPDIHPTTWKVFRALQGGAKLSRNKHFYLFKDPLARAALRLHRYLESVIADVRRCQQDLSVSVVHGPDSTTGQYALRIEFPLVNGHRTAYLRSVELKLLADRAPDLAHFLSAQLDA